MKKITTILGTRPEIIKLSSLIPLLDQKFNQVLIHTGQHYDYEMDGAFFDELHLPAPKHHLRVGSGNQGEQTGKMIQLLEPILILEKPDAVLIQGDTNTTLAGAIAASKLHLPLIHIEAGCRSFNKTMPEEINRIVADLVSDYLFAADENSRQNLLKEGIPTHKIKVAGNTVYDACLRAKKLAASSSILQQHDLISGKYVLVTIHRAESTTPIILSQIIAALNILSKDIDIIFPLHPRTRKVLEEENLILNPRIKVIPPAGYINFIALLSSCRFCISDSGGIQDEAIVFNVPCIIPRNETEWPKLVEAGKNFIVGNSTTGIIRKAEDLLNDTLLGRVKSIPLKYPRNVSTKIMEHLTHVLA